jgi:hypothetical protein
MNDSYLKTINLTIAQNFQEYQWERERSTPGKRLAVDVIARFTELPVE